VRSATHSVLGSSTSLVVSGRMRIECHNSLTPIELNHHEAVKVGIVLGARQIVMSFDKSISSRFSAREEIVDLSCRVIMDVAESLDV